VQVLPGLSGARCATSSDDVHDVTHVKVEDDIDVKVEEDVFVKEEVDIGTKEEEDINLNVEEAGVKVKVEDSAMDVTFPEMKAEQDEVSYVYVCIL
jgi:hypothetical protein